MSLWQSEGARAATIALATGVGLALVFDLAGPKGDSGRVATTAVRVNTGPNDTLAARMEAQIAAGAPGVALALERASPSSDERGAAVAAARAHAQFELGDAPAAWSTVQTSIRICETLKTCSFTERSTLRHLDIIFGAIVQAGVVDPKRDPSRVDRALRGLVHAAQFTQ